MKRAAIVGLTLASVLFLGLLGAGGAQSIEAASAAPMRAQAVVHDTGTLPQLDTGVLYPDESLTAPEAKEERIELAKLSAAADTNEKQINFTCDWLTHAMVDQGITVEVGESVYLRHESTIFPGPTTTNVAAIEIIGIRWDVPGAFQAGTFPPATVTDLAVYSPSYDPNVPPAGPFTDIPPVEVYFDADGTYPVFMRAIVATWYNDGTLTKLDFCPVAPDYAVLPGAVVVGSPVEINPADFEAVDIIGEFDGHALLPLNDWMPLFAFTMKYPNDSRAPRMLARLTFRIRRDPLAGDRPWEALFAPREESFLQWGLFRDLGPSPGEDPDQLLGDERDNPPMLTWENNGAPYEIPVGKNPDGSLIYSYGDGLYDLCFFFDPSDPDFPVPYNPTLFVDSNWPKLPANEWVTAGVDPNNSYIVAFQTSALWRSGQTLSYEVLNAVMLPINGSVAGQFPYGNDGPLDSYTPDFYDSPPQILSEDVSYSSSFSFFDLRGDKQRAGEAYLENRWNWQNFMYTPKDEFMRPRFDVTGQLLQSVGGEYLDVREIFSIEQFEAIIGLNAHGSSGDQPVEINIICTDIGADPYGPPGNGGFNPKEGLEKFTTTQIASETSARNEDYGFNGLWMWHDTGGSSNFAEPFNCIGDGIFNKPIPNSVTGGVTFNPDSPMRPLYWEPLSDDDTNFINPGLMEWEYIPFPPGGGDPWWKIRLRFEDGRRRPSDDPCLGTLEPVPDVFSTGLPQPDYFIVIRADSGFDDVSGALGDGTSLAMGADTRVFIEPRRWNPRFGGHWDGGVLYSNQINSLVEHNGIISSESDSTVYFLDWYSPDFYWQDYVVQLDEEMTPFTSVPPAERLGNARSFFHQRDMVPENMKPIRSSVEIHDLVMTFATNNLYAKVTEINVGQSTDISKWIDPQIFTTDGIREVQMLSMDKPWILPDLRAGWMSDDDLISIQYSFETVPFRLHGNAIDAHLDDPRSTYFPSPSEQPTLPKFGSWPADNPPFSYGYSSMCYLDSEGPMANNENYREPTSSNTENLYRDDVYVFEVWVHDGSTLGDGVAAGKWLVDSNNGKFYILDNIGNQLFLERGHAAYVGRYQRGGAALAVPDYPFQISVGPNFAVARGYWMIVDDTLPRGVYPQLSDWPEGLSSTEYPGVAEPGLRGARLLKQYAEVNSHPIAMLGVNLAGTDDPNVASYTDLSLKSLTVAFWGPNFTPQDLATLSGTAGTNSGVLLYEDSNGNGVYDPPTIIDDPSYGVLSIPDKPVTLNPASLIWPQRPEPVDTDGDFIPDDMSGDGIVYYGGQGYADSDGDGAHDSTPLDPVTELPLVWDGLSDEAWVLRLEPATLWTLPRTDYGTSDASLILGDGAGSDTSGGDGGDSGGDSGGDDGDDRDKAMGDFRAVTPTMVDMGNAAPAKAGTVEKVAKALPVSGSKGDDLFVVVRTSRTVGAFEEFRCIVPSKLPSRTLPIEQAAGAEILPPSYSVVDSFVKLNPDEGAVQDFYGHDMLPVDVPVIIQDITDPDSNVIAPAAGIQAVLGIDASMNQPDKIVASGDGVGAVSDNGAGTFTPATITANPTHGTTYFDGAAWVSSAVTGMYLVGMSDTPDLDDSRVETYEIIGTTGTTLELRAGAPKAGSDWYVVKDPSMMETIIVEFYDIGDDGGLDLARDFFPLDHENPKTGNFSGVALYRDNDWHPNNTNGVFDPPEFDANGNFVQYIDLPVMLDDPPILIGTPGGEPSYQVKFVFSSPGTDNLVGRDTMAYEDQPRLRQVIPQTWGLSVSDKDFGSDFFVALRPSFDISPLDDFQVAIVSWGPDTPSAPDPDNFSTSLVSGNLPGQQEHEFDIFEEYPWGNRALGFITMFQNPIEYRHWAVDKRTRKVVARMELDHSQDALDVQNWLRTSPNKHGRTKTLVAAAPPLLDFVGQPTRQTTVDPVQFTLLTNMTYVAVSWDFGDGSAGSTDPNPAHTYGTPGVYDVAVTVTDEYGIEHVISKVEYITILNAPFVDFIGDPTQGNLRPDPMDDEVPPGMNVEFTNRSVIPAQYNVISYSWSFGDGSSSAEENPIHRYIAEGFYTVSLELLLEDTGAGTQFPIQYQRIDYIIVGPCIGCPTTGEGEGEGTTEGEGEGSGEGEGEGEGEATPAADFTVEDAIVDKHALVPLHDWVPLFRFTMSYEEDVVADRFLNNLIYTIRADDRDRDDLQYNNDGGPQISDILEFGLFRESFADGDEDGVLDVVYDNLMGTWSATGAPYGTVTGSGRFSPLRYELNFVTGGTPENPLLPVPAAPKIDGVSPDGAVYYVAVRTSATWRSESTMSMDVLLADMIDPATGGIPVTEEPGEEGEEPTQTPVDTYSPNFGDGETLESEAGYSASFTALEISGSPGGEFEPGFFNSWNYAEALYVPVEEHSRPRWNKIDELLEVYPAALLSVRELVALDTWREVIGLNIHSGHPFSYADPEDQAQLDEVNIIVTDIGADPYGAPGNGGFNPRDGLKPVEVDWDDDFESGAILHDVAFNGIWVWHDSNNNAVFDPPTMSADGGITFNGDYPMQPSFREGREFIPWEYIPLPPDGGDPWWKIQLDFFDGRRASGDTYDGYLEPIPDNIESDPFPAAYTSDYFVVIRTDSGFADVSGLAGDGTGAQMGADFRVFIEPRHLDGDGNNVGGVHMNSMIPDVYGITNWQDDPRWGSVEPWWPERTLNAAATKPMKLSVDVHDLVLTYHSDSNYARQTDIFFGAWPLPYGGCLGYADGFGAGSDFSQWMDPFDIYRSRFYNGHTVGVWRWQFQWSTTVNFAGFDVTFYFDNETFGQYAYETVPFDQGDAFEDPDWNDNRSVAYPEPMPAPSLPMFSTWPATLNPGEYPRASDWDIDDTAARLLTQKTDVSSNQHVAMLGINAVGTGDPVVFNGRERPTLAKIVVAFWGPDFTPDDLLPLDPEGLSFDSGVLLWEDNDSDAVFFTPSNLQSYTDANLDTSAFDAPLKLRNLEWGGNAEPIDLDGDGIPDDMNGDGVVDSSDNAWVLTLYPDVQWELPTDDGYNRSVTYSIIDCAVGGFGKDNDKQGGEKQSLDLGSENPGDDLFVTIRTSDNLKRFESFRAVVPATLPARSENTRQAGIQFYPQMNTSATAFLKNSPEEDPVQDFYGHDMLEANVPTRLMDLTSQNQVIYIGGAAVPTLGIDVATNRPEDILAEGGAGVGGAGSFVVAGANWSSNELAGDWLIDSGYEAYEIMANSTDQLTLRSGTPRNGLWHIVRNPSFLEEVTIELYQEGEIADFNPELDLLPLDLNQEISGVAIYRDNHEHPSNRRGLFDPGVDIPLTLDAAPRYRGLVGESTQVKFVFSSPGTDSIPSDIASQPRNRQWVPPVFGDEPGSPYAGADFFIVLRASDKMEDDEDFRIAIVSWGPNTPTQPDPDTWAGLPGEERNEYRLFQEYPWAERGVGFITFFKDPKVYYYMDGYTAGQRPDTSGVNWLRSHTAKKRQSGTITAQVRPITPTSVMIDSVSNSVLPNQLDPGASVDVLIYGENFGSNPQVFITGYDVEILSATDELIEVRLTIPAGTTPSAPVILTVRNTDTNQSSSRSDLFTVGGSGSDTPVEILSITPPLGGPGAFPVTIYGQNFPVKSCVQVYFNDTLMPVLSVSMDGTQIVVGYPVGGMPDNGLVNVTVRDTCGNSEDTVANVFNFTNDNFRQGKFGTSFTCGAADAPRGGGFSDMLVLLTAVAFLLWGTRRSAVAVKKQ